VATKFAGNQRRGLTTGVPERSPAPLHYVVVRHGDEGSEVLRIPLEAKGRVLPVFSAGWAARGYVFAEAPGGGWYVRPCTPGELVSLIVGPCAGVELVALDPRPGPRSGGEAATGHAVGELRGLPVGFDAPPFLLRRGDFEATENRAAWAKRRSVVE
jgi:hypothetical protein